MYYSPFFAHALEAWAQRRHPNMLFLFYEDMKNVQIPLSLYLVSSTDYSYLTALFQWQNLRGEIERVADFLGKSLSGEQLARLVAHLQFENFAKNESVNFEAGKQMGFMNQEGRFIRKGIHHYFNLTQLFRDKKKTTTKSYYLK